MFADSLAAWTSRIEIADLEQKLINFLNKVIDWNNNYNMVLSTKKGKFTTTLFTNNKKERLPIIKMNNTTLQAKKI